MDVLKSIWHLMYEYPIPCLGVWVVYKFQHFIFRKKMEDGFEIHGKYKSYDESRYKTLKKIQEEYPDTPINKENWEDEEGKYWILEVLHIVVKVVFIPVKVDDE